jgi:S-adenosylmethionine:tRNA ribosyltransferase-isomerase
MSGKAEQAERLAPYDYELPPERIALRPTEARDGARLLVLEPTGFAESAIRALPDLLQQGDLLVVNNTRVLAARIHARRASGGAVELLLLEGEGVQVPALVKPGRKIKPGEVLEILDAEGAPVPGVSATVGHVQPDGRRQVALRPSPEVVMSAAGQVPLPPYIDRAPDEEDRVRYQTVFAEAPGAIAAPTAGLHLSSRILGELEAKGVQTAKITLHVGPGTFQNLRPEDLARGTLHAERCLIPEATAAAIEATRARGGRVVAVGTTVTRTLESRALPGGLVQAGAGATDLFIQPGHHFQVVDALLTNFHLPRTSLLMLVCAMGGRDLVMDAYAHAVASDFRFYSYGDAMFLSGFRTGSPA